MYKKYIIGFIFALALLQGCSGENSNMGLESIGNNANKGYLNIFDGKTNNYDYNDNDTNNADMPDDDMNRENKTAEERAKSISNHIKDVVKLEKVSVVITGNTAIVGINTDDDASDREILDLKYEIEEQVKNIDKKIKQVSITATPELFERITNLTGDDYDEEKEELKENSENAIEFSKIVPVP